MIVGERKPFDEIKEMMKSFKKVLNVGCGGCTSICMAGGQREVGLLNEELQNAFKQEGVPFQIDGFTIERQCNADFFPDLDEIARTYEAILSMACGAGVQFLADRIPFSLAWTGISDGLRKIVAPAESASWERQLESVLLQDVPKAFSMDLAGELLEKANAK